MGQVQLPSSHVLAHSLLDPPIRAGRSGLGAGVRTKEKSLWNCLYFCSACYCVDIHEI